MREFIDKNRPAQWKYERMLAAYDEENADDFIEDMMELLDEDPDFLEPYLHTFKEAMAIGDEEEAYDILDLAANRALDLILDKDGRWPDSLLWGFLENRHIIRTLITAGEEAWALGDGSKALGLLEKILRSNPNDNPGVRYYILAIKEGMTRRRFTRKFDKGGYYDDDVEVWFREAVKNHEDDFAWWFEAIKEEPAEPGN